jgi:hypothetical protein
MNALQEIAAAEKSRQPIKGPNVYRWSQDDRDEVFDRLSGLLLQGPRRFDVDGLDWGLEAVVDFMAEAARRPRETRPNDDALSPFDALQDLYWLFRHMWSWQGWPNDVQEIRQRHLARIRDALEQLVADWPSPLAEFVLVVVLEHLFANPAIRTYFDGWKDDPALGEVHREACALSSIGEL